MRLKQPIAIIGRGAIGRWVAERLDGPVTIIGRDDPVPEVVLEVEVAGHEALAAYGAATLARGIDLLVASVGALADPELAARLFAAAGTGRVILPAGALVGITEGELPLPDNRRSCSLTAMSLLRAIRLSISIESGPRIGVQEGV